MSSSSTTAGATNRGSLTIAGSGITSVSHMTLETVTALKNAEKVFYSVGDPVTEAFIQENNKDVVDLTIYYDVSKERYQTYVEMAEIMLREVRAGKNVLGIFYGHPGFFVAPSHRALTLAREEGYEAKMLPGLSSFDYMTADLEIEPAHYGCTIYEATDLLVRGKRLDPSGHNIILQIAAAGVSTLNHENSKLQRLVDHLVQDFGSEHKVVLYVGGVLPQSSSAMAVYAIDDFRNDQLANVINSRSSLYIPPRDIPPVNPSEFAALGLHDVSLPLFDASPRWVGPRFVEAANSGPAERAIVAQLDQHVTPADHKSLRASTAMKRYMLDLALDPAKLKAYKANPSAAIEGVEGLTESEKVALQLGTEGPIGAVMWRASAEEPTPDQLRSILDWLVGWLFPAVPYAT